MALPTRESKVKIMVFAIVFFVFMSILLGRIGYLQLLKGEEYEKAALNQWSRGTPISAVRGTIYDKNGVKLALSLNRDTVWARPGDIPESDIEKTADTLSSVLDMDREELEKTLRENEYTVRIKQWIEKDQSDELKSKNLQGIDVAEDSKRYYPRGDFASYVIGHTNFDQVGQYGIESALDKELAGADGKLVVIADGRDGQLPYGKERRYEPRNGYDVKLTIDSKIQEFAEEAVRKAIAEHKPQNASAIVMNPNTGEVLAMASGPGYDLNNPREAKDEKIKAKWDNLSDEEKQSYWFKMWRNYNMNDIYEPGSTFKTLIVGAALEENLISTDSTFYCDGYASGIESSAPIKCWRYYDPHGEQTLSEGLQNSCNDMMVDIGLLLGGDKIYEYVHSFGFGSETGIGLTGESTGILPASAEDVKNATLANISFGQGISVTPMQLITALSSIANGGDLMKPTIVSEVVDQEGKVVSKLKPEVVKKVLSEETAKEVLSMTGDAAKKSYAGKISVPGYNIGAKTGTSQKIVEGAYSNKEHIGSFFGVAPLESPEIVVLTVVDEPTAGKYFGIDTAGPMGEEILKKTLKYLGAERSDTGDGEGLSVKVPDLKGKKMSEAVAKLDEIGLDYTTDSYYMDPESPIVDQYPEAGTSLEYGSFVKIYLEGKRKENIETPSFEGKTKEEAKAELESLGLKYDLSGEGKAKRQEPTPGTIIDSSTTVKVEFD